MQAALEAGVPLAAAALAIALTGAAIAGSDEPRITSFEARTDSLVVRLVDSAEAGAALAHGFLLACSFAVPLPPSAEAVFFRAVRVGPGGYTLESAPEPGGPWEVPAGLRPLAAPGDEPEPPGAAEGRERQQSCAAQLGLPIEVENSLGMRFRLIPPGELLMGSPPDEPGRNVDESPQHRVVLAAPLWVGTCEVTQGQWGALMGSVPGSFGDHSLRPVERVDWDKCQEFVRRLNLREGGGYRLLTEAEWEYACRAGTRRVFHAGDTAADLDRVAWYWDNSGLMTHHVGLKASNAWGLHDMHGNVWEWVEDDYFRSYTGAPLDGSPWMRSPRHWHRVMRGGCWSTPAAQSRSATRFGDTHGFAAYTTGLRIARDLSVE